MKNQCAYCYRKFGLVRYRRGFKSFCSKVCVDRYIVLLRAEFLKRLNSAGFSGLQSSIGRRAEKRGGTRAVPL